jgi:NADPH-dependent curcumin reductase CurA
VKIDKWVVREHMDGVPDVGRLYEKVTENTDIELGHDEMLLRTLYVSVDLYLHGIARDTPVGDDTERVRKALLRAAPDGIDKYFDNLGGTLTDAVFPLLNIGGQVAVCWQWATQVGNDGVGPRLLPHIMFPRVTIRGIFAPEWFTEQNWATLHDELGGMVRSGEIAFHQTIYHGFDAIPRAYESLYRNSGANRGKVLIAL